MVIFNNVPITSFPGLMVEDIHVSPIQLQSIARERPIRFGAELERISGGVRTVTISFALLDMDKTSRSLLLMSLTRWARSAVPGKLQIVGYPDMHLMAAATDIPTPSMRQWWEDGLKVVFTAYEPYWISDVEQTAVCGQTFMVGGSAPPLMRITRTLSSQANNQSWSDGTDTITLTQVPAGLLTIDLDKQTIDVGGTSIMDKYTIESRFILPHIGSMNISGTGNVVWQERWE